MRYGSSIFLFLIFISTICCNQQVSFHHPGHWANIPEPLLQALEAHGGLEQWAKMKTMEFSIPKDTLKEFHRIDLPSRKVQITHPNYTIGFDGSDVWVSPDKEAFGGTSARFYHNLIFYFYAIPFVLADPGINYELLEERKMNGRDLIPVKVSYGSGIGDAPDDFYIAHFDKDSKELYLLLYTVTYFSGETNERYSAIIYDEWTTNNGLKVPKVMKGFRYAADTLGTQRYTRVFEDIRLSEEAVDPLLFERPERSEIDTLINR